MQLLQGILYFIDIKLWHNSKNHIFPQENELFFAIFNKVECKGNLTQELLWTKTLHNLDILVSKFTITVQSIGSFCNLESK